MLDQSSAGGTGWICALTGPLEDLAAGLIRPSTASAYGGSYRPKQSQEVRRDWNQDRHHQYNLFTHICSLTPQAASTSWAAHSGGWLDQNYDRARPAAVDGVSPGNASGLLRAYHLSLGGYLLAWGRPMSLHPPCRYTFRSVRTASGIAMTLANVTTCRRPPTIRACVPGRRLGCGPTSGRHSGSNHWKDRSSSRTVRPFG